MSRSSISERAAAPKGHRTTSPKRIWSAHISVFDAKPVGRRNVHGTPESSMARSARAQKEPGRSPAGCADRYTTRVTWREAIFATWGARAAVHLGRGERPEQEQRAGAPQVRLERRGVGQVG